MVTPPPIITGAEPRQPPAIIDQRKDPHFSNSVKWRINRHFGVSRISVVCVKAGMWALCPGLISQRE